jgi:putative transposase
MACFRQDADYLVYLSNLRELSAKHDCSLHAYCLMTNHVHLLLTPTTADACPSLMRDLGQRYVQYYNRRYDRSGTLWEGRFRSCVTESARYVLACYRYIELNPVRAGMASHPGAYPWSSHAANAGTLAETSLSPHSEFLALAADEGTRRRCYAALFKDRIDEAVQQAIRAATNGGYPLVSEGFKAAVIQPLGWKTAPGKPGPSKPNSKLEPDLRQTEFGL